MPLAEEMLLSLILREPALMDEVRDLEADMFSSPLLGRVYDQLCQRHRQGLEVSFSGLVDFEPEEMSHIAGILQRQDGPVNEQALRDCALTIREEYQKPHTQSTDDLMRLREKMQKSKGIKA